MRVCGCPRSCGCDGRHRRFLARRVCRSRQLDLGFALLRRCPLSAARTRFKVKVLPQGSACALCRAGGGRLMCRSRFCVRPPPLAASRTRSSPAARTRSSPAARTRSSPAARRTRSSPVAWAMRSSLAARTTRSTPAARMTRSSRRSGRKSLLDRGLLQLPTLWQSLRI